MHVLCEPTLNELGVVVLVHPQWCFPSVSTLWSGVVALGNQGGGEFPSRRIVLSCRNDHTLKLG